MGLRRRRRLGASRRNHCHEGTRHRRSRLLPRPVVCPARLSGFLARCLGPPSLNQTSGAATGRRGLFGPVRLAHSFCGNLWRRANRAGVSRRGPDRDLRDSIAARRVVTASVRPVMRALKPFACDIGIGCQHAGSLSMSFEVVAGDPSMVFFLRFKQRYRWSAQDQTRTGDDFLCECGL